MIKNTNNKRTNNKIKPNEPFIERINEDLLKDDNTIELMVLVPEKTDSCYLIITTELLAAVMLVVLEKDNVFSNVAYCLTRLDESYNNTLIKRELSTNTQKFLTMFNENFEATSEDDLKKIESYIAALVPKSTGDKKNTFRNIQVLHLSVLKNFNEDDIEKYYLKESILVTLKKVYLAAVEERSLEKINISYIPVKCLKIIEDTNDEIIIKNESNIIIKSSYKMTVEKLSETQDNNSGSDRQNAFAGDKNSVVTFNNLEAISYNTALHQNPNGIDPKRIFNIRREEQALSISRNSRNHGFHADLMLSEAFKRKNSEDDKNKRGNKREKIEQNERVVPTNK